MSAWGTGIKQSDEFMDVYDDFFDRYRDDAAAMEIYRAILAEYQEEFSDGDSGPLLYTVCYALAQCLWECGERDEWLWQTIREIIDTEADLNFWDELGMEPELKKSRQRALDKFWDKINSVPAKAPKAQENREETGAYPPQGGSLRLRRRGGLPRRPGSGLRLELLPHRHHRGGLRPYPHRGRGHGRPFPRGNVVHGAGVHPQKGSDLCFLLAHQQKLQ